MEVGVEKAALTGRVSATVTVESGYGDGAVLSEEVPGTEALPILTRAVLELREALGDQEGKQWIIVSRQYHNCPSAIGTFRSLEEARAYYDQLYKTHPEDPIFGDEAQFHELVNP